MTLSQVQKLFASAVCPEDIFGPDVDAKYLELAKITHPDKNPKGHEAFVALENWYGKAQFKISEGTYGDNKPVFREVTIKTKKDTYTITGRMASGDICEVYHGKNGKGPLVFKVCKSPRDNDLVAAEAEILRHFRADSPVSKLAVMAHIPVLVDTFELKQAKVKKRVNVFGVTKKCLTLADILTKYPAGIDLRDAAWMFNRLLGALLACHQAGYVHGAVVPEHFLVFPFENEDEHNGILIDWSYSVKKGQNIKAIVPARKNFYPTEVFEKKPASFGTDLYMASMCLLALLGGDVSARKLPISVPRPISGLIRACQLAPGHRSQDVFELFEDFGATLKALYGPPKFRRFAVNT